MHDWALFVVFGAFAQVGIHRFQGAVDAEHTSCRFPKVGVRIVDRASVLRTKQEEAENLRVKVFQDFPYGEEVV